ncbi:MAG: carboxy terminal-processing peptidase [Sphingobacteriaceae bacterium]
MKFKFFKEMLKRIFLGLFIAATLACSADPRVRVEVPGSLNLKPDAQQELVAKEIVNLIENYHYKKVALNDSISSLIYDSYLKALDAGRNYFLQSDLDDFSQYRFSFDDDLKAGDLSVPFYMFNVYQKRYNERMKFALSQINQPFDFTLDEAYTYDREKLPWFKTDEEANRLWSKKVKYDLLNLKLTGNDAAKNIKTLQLRYENLITQSGKNNNQDVYQILMNAFTESIDPHTNYFVPTRAQEFNEEMARTFEGIGARLQLDNEVVKVAEIIPGGPAHKAKTLNVNDRIIAVAQGKEGEFVDVIGWRIDNTVSKIKGPKGTLVRLKVIPAGQELSAKPIIVELMRDKVVLQDQSAKKTIKIITSGNKTFKIGLIEIPAFYADFKAYQSGDPNYKSTTRDVRLLLDTLKQQKVDGVIIDLRANGGGSLMEAIELTGLFIKTGPVVQVKDRRGVEVDQDEDPEIAYTGPLGVMVDRFSASASEIFAGAIQDYGRGILMGTQTYGKGTVQSSIDVSRLISPTDRLMLLTKKQEEETAQNVSVSRPNAPQFGQINLTMAKFYRINGSSTQHKGVLPDIQFPMVFPADKYGESSETSALPWDTIKPSKYVPVANLTDIKAKLLKLHEQRMKNAEEYKYLLEDIKDFRKRDEETSVSTAETKLKADREQQEIKNLERENKRRLARGLPALKKGDPKSKDDYDFIEDESLKIMADFIPAIKG